MDVQQHPEQLQPTATIDQEITQYLSRVNNQQKEAVLHVIKTFAANRQDWWHGISKEQQQAIDKSLTEMKAGNVVPQEDALKKYRK